LLGLLQYFWPMLRVPVTTAWRVAVHSPWLAHDLSEEFPDTPVETIAMGVADPLAVEDAPGAACPSSAAVRTRHGIPSDAIVLAAFGRVTPEKRIWPAVRALAAVAAQGVRVHLLLVGEPASHYDVVSEADRCGLSGHVTLTGYVSNDELPSYLRTADVCLCLRWPAARETSASWLRCLAAGKPTVVTDLAHTVDVAALDPRNWSVLPAAVPALTGGRPSTEPVCVAVNVFDEQRSLALAVERLTADAALRERLGTAARRHFEQRHTLAQMTADYRRVLETTLGEGVNPASARARASLPAHLLDDSSAAARALLDEVGASGDFLAE
jgi:glycosyltransferase involved in cell wall biosynthesis